MLSMLRDVAFRGFQQIECTSTLLYTVGRSHTPQLAGGCDRLSPSDLASFVLSRERRRARESWRVLALSLQVASGRPLGTERIDFRFRPCSGTALRGGWSTRLGPSRPQGSRTVCFGSGGLPVQSSCEVTALQKPPGVGRPLLCTRVALVGRRHVRLTGRRLLPPEGIGSPPQQSAALATFAHCALR